MANVMPTIAMTNLQLSSGGWSNDNILAQFGSCWLVRIGTFEFVLLDLNLNELADALIPLVWRPTQIDLVCIGFHQ
jgi:hypothetical protein